MSTDILWRILQITDSAFPTGGFAHSSGIESAIQHGELRTLSDLESYLNDSLWQIGFSALPLANVAFDDLDCLQDCDELSDVFLRNHVANRASRVQGQTFFSTSEKAFLEQVPELKKLRRLMERPDYYFHYAPVFGVTMRVLEIEKSWMQKIFLQISLRSMLSASVRLGVLGPYQAQQLQSNFSSTLTSVLQQCQTFNLSDIAQTAPLLEIYQANQDRLYSKLFQS